MVEEEECKTIIVTYQVSEGWAKLVLDFNSYTEEIGCHLKQWNKEKQKMKNTDPMTLKKELKALFRDGSSTMDKIREVEQKMDQILERKECFQRQQS